MTNRDSSWVDWAKQIRAISQIGQTYAKDPYDLDRYRQLGDIAHAMIAKLADTPLQRVANFFIPDSGYATPKVDLRAGVFKDGNILLVKEKTDNHWSLPGGWADVNESPRQGIEREVREESGYEVSVERLVAIKDRSLHGYTPQYPDHLFKLFFLCRLQGGEPTPNMEVSEIAFFALDALPELSISRILEDDIRLLDDYRRHPDKITYCD